VVDAVGYAVNDVQVAVVDAAVDVVDVGDTGVGYAAAESAGWRGADSAVVVAGSAGEDTDVGYVAVGQTGPAADVADAEADADAEDHAEYTGVSGIAGTGLADDWAGELAGPAEADQEPTWATTQLIPSPPSPACDPSSATCASGPNAALLNSAGDSWPSTYCASAFPCKDP
jgi:hypothetical protein